MEVRRVFVDKLKMKNGMVLVTGPNCKYILGVLRKGVGERIDVMDGKGYLYRCTINGTKGKELFLQVMDAVYHPEEKRTRVTLLVSPIKGPRMDWLVEKATELGVDRILPTIFKRTVVKFQDEGVGEVRAVETDHDRGFPAVGPLLDAGARTPHSAAWGASLCRSPREPLAPL